jgi:Flp pilus assembly secretin CpaC
MKVLVICLVLLACTVQADEINPQIMIRAEFIAVPKAVLDDVGRAAPEQIPSAELILGFKKSGQATVITAPTILTQSGGEARVKAVQEVAYPTDLAITDHTTTNAADRPAIPTVIAPCDFETREVGAIFATLAELNRETLELHLSIHAELVALPKWQKFDALYIDTAGNTATASLRRPCFRTHRVDTFVRIKSGTTILAGSINDAGDENVTFLLVTAQLVDATQRPIAPSAQTQD